MGRLSPEDYERLLQGEDDGVERVNDEATASEGEPLSEAEQAAANAEGPKRRGDGRVLGAYRPRALTAAQREFAHGIVQGKSIRQAYRDAYPNAQGADATISTCAYQLARHPLVAEYVRECWEQTREALVEDMAAARRYVLGRLVELSREAKQEGSRLKALELLGRGAGLFRDAAPAADKPLSADELKRQLQGHLRLVDASKASKAV